MLAGWERQHLCSTSAAAGWAARRGGEHRDELHLLQVSAILCITSEPLQHPLAEVHEMTQVFINYCVGSARRYSSRAEYLRSGNAQSELPKTVGHSHSFLFLINLFIFFISVGSVLWPEDNFV